MKRKGLLLLIIILIVIAGVIKSAIASTPIIPKKIVSEEPKLVSDVVDKVDTVNSQSKAEPITTSNPNTLNSEMTQAYADNFKIKSITKFSFLKVTDAVYENKVLTVKGNTDLPNKSVLKVSIIPQGTLNGFDDTGDEKEKINEPKSLTADAKVENGRFISTIPVPHSPILYQGPYKIEVKFFLDMQTNLNVLHKIGDGAKNLTGKRVVLLPISNYKSLQYSVIRQIDALELEAYSVIMPKGAHRGNAKFVLARFFQAWEQEDWKLMVKYSYKTWVKDEKASTLFLRSWFAQRKLIGSKILDIPHSNPLMKEVNYIIYYLEVGDIKATVKTSVGTAKVIRDDSYNWCVFPLSIIDKNAVLRENLPLNKLIND